MPIHDQTFLRSVMRHRNGRKHPCRMVWKSGSTRKFSNLHVSHGCAEAVAINPVYEPRASRNHAGVSKPKMWNVTPVDHLEVAFKTAELSERTLSAAMSLNMQPQKRTQSNADEAGKRRCQDSQSHLQCSSFAAVWNRLQRFATSAACR